MIAGSGPVFQGEFSLLLVYGVTWITVEPLHNAHLGDGRKWPLVFLKDPTRALFLALAKSIYQTLNLLTPDPLEAMPFFTELVPGAGHQRPLREHLILSIILVIKLMRKIYMELSLLGHLNSNFSGIISGDSSTVDCNISVFFDMRWYLFASVNYWTHQRSQQFPKFNWLMNRNFFECDWLGNFKTPWSQ